MMTKKGTSRHTTVIDAAKPITRFFERNTLVRKYTCGVITMRLRPSAKRVRLSECEVGYHCIVRGTSSLQRFVVFLSDVDQRELFIKELTNVCGKYSIVLRVIE